MATWPLTYAAITPARDERENLPRVFATLAAQTRVRAHDALHLGAARRLGTGLSFLTFDVRQAEAARSLGFRVLGS